MAYRVIKTIRGVQYLYEQSSYRVGKKVFTKCRCLGRVDGFSGLSDSLTVRSDLVPDQSAGEVDTALPGPANPPRVQAQAERSIKNIAPLSIRVELSDHRISAKSLHKEVDLALGLLKANGVAPSCFPDIAVKYANEAGFRRSWRTGKYTVSLPWLSTGKRQQFKRIFSQTVSHAVLDAVGKQDPLKYSQIAEAFDAEYRASTTAIASYLLHASPKGWYSLVSLYVFRVVNRSRECLPAASKLGMVDFQKRRGWRDEATKLMSLIRKQGYESVLAANQKELASSRRAITLAGNKMRSLVPFLPRWWKARHKFRAELAREQAIMSQQRKLQLLINLTFKR
ncbi:hypothetical protein [Acanthopleuribacter pedis]